MMRSLESHTNGLNVYDKIVVSYISHLDYLLLQNEDHANNDPSILSAFNAITFTLTASLNLLIVITSLVIVAYSVRISMKEKYKAK